MTQQGKHDRLRTMLLTLSDRVRHPGLPLSLFLDPDKVHAMDEDADTSVWSDNAPELHRSPLDPDGSSGRLVTALQSG
ncbi:hypothetical protein ACQPYE_17935 [Actinosynnema sp. CA-299493]